MENKTVIMFMDEYIKLHPNPVKEMEDKYAAQDKALNGVGG